MSQPHDEWFYKLATLRVDMLTETERAAFHEHIESCALCREQFEQYRMVDDTLRCYFSLPILSAEPPPLPASLRARAIEEPQKVKSEWYEIRSQAKQFIHAFGMQSVIIALSAGLLTFVLGMYIVRVPGVNFAIVTPLANIAIAAVILVIVMRRSLVLREEWSNQASGRRYLAPPTKSALLFPSRSETSEIESGSEEPRILSLPLAKPFSNEKGWRDRGRLLIISLTLLAVGLASLSISLLNPANPSRPASAIGQSSASANVSVPPPPTGISSTGDRVFDIGGNRKDIAFKQAAAQEIVQGNIALARQNWKQALAVDSGDAEVLIYQENQQVRDDVHVAPARFSMRTLVVYTTLAQEHIGGGQDILQGAYVAQAEHNARVRQSSGMLLLLMLAVTNKDSASIVRVTQQVVNAAQHDASILGVMGLPTSSITSVAYPLLAEAHLPMVSPTSSSVSLSGVSRYFFRIAPQDTFQGRAGADYAHKELHASRVALFVDESDPYSRSLADAFEKNFVDLEHSIDIMQYEQGQPATIEAGFRRVEQLSKKPDLIYFAGFVNDATVILKLLPKCTAQGACLKVMGGDALYVQGDYSLEAYKSYARLIFTAFAFSDAWKVQGMQQEPGFFKEYTQDFDPSGQYQPGKYGVNRADADAILSYDAMQAFLYAMTQAEVQHTLTPEGVRQGLSALNSTNALQGVSRKIAFGPDGNPLDSQVVILVGGPDNQTTLAGIEPGSDK